METDMPHLAQPHLLASGIPHNLRLSIDAPRATPRARLLALLAAEAVLARAGVTLSACYCELVTAGDAFGSDGGIDPDVVLTLDRAGKAARATLKQLGQPVPRGACLVLLAVF